MKGVSRAALLVKNIRFGPLWTAVCGSGHYVLVPDWGDIRDIGILEHGSDTVALWWFSLNKKVWTWLAWRTISLRETVDCYSETENRHNSGTCLAMRTQILQMKVQMRRESRLNNIRIQKWSTTGKETEITVLVWFIVSKLYFKLKTNRHFYE